MDFIDPQEEYMALERTNKLKMAFYETYNGFADKRYKRIENDKPFTVDDRGPGDYDARKELFLWFCQISLTVIDGESVEIAFRGGVPQSPKVARWFERMDGKKTTFHGIVVVLKKGQQDELKGLASAFNEIVSPGNSYDVPAYKYVSPRTAASLSKLAAVLDRGWSD